MYYVEYLFPLPDYKRPSVESLVNFYKTEKEADLAVLKLKQRLLDEWNEYNDTDKPFTLQDLDSDEYFDHIYSDSYMELDPYFIKKGKVECD
jgi:hypothetical protein